MFQVLANFGILGSVMVGRGFQHILFGSLRANEVEVRVAYPYDFRMEN